MAGPSRPPVDPSNAGQARAWDGEQGESWATQAERFEGSAARYDAAFFGAAAIDGSARVLDVGCGTGATTRTAARLATQGLALGLDLSARMIEVARELAARERLGNAVFEQADAQIHPFAPRSVDVVISRTGAMFFGDPVAAFRNLARALRPSRRLVLLVWQEPSRNEWFTAIAGALAAGRPLPAPPFTEPGPFSLSDPDRVRRLLATAGFAAPQVSGCHEPMDFGPNADDAYRFILDLAGWMLDGLDDRARARALDELRRRIEAHASTEGVLLDSAAWLVTAQRP